VQALLRGQVKTEKCTVVRSSNGDKLLVQGSHGEAAFDQFQLDAASAATSSASSLAARRLVAAALR
jgi:hypothetical protein